MQKFYILSNIPNLYPMTHKEACTMRKKLMNPNNHQLVEVIPAIAEIKTDNGFVFADNRRVEKIIVMKPLYANDSKWFEFIPSDATSTKKMFVIHKEDFKIINNGYMPQFESWRA